MFEVIELDINFHHRLVINTVACSFQLFCTFLCFFACVTSQICAPTWWCAHPKVSFIATLKSRWGSSSFSDAVNSSYKAPKLWWFKFAVQIALESGNGTKISDKK